MTNLIFFFYFPPPSLCHKRESPDPESDKEMRVQKVIKKPPPVKRHQALKLPKHGTQTHDSHGDKVEGIPGKMVRIFTDGACSNNQDPVSRRAGSGVYIMTDEGTRGISIPFLSGPHTSNRAEIYGAIEAMKQLNTMDKCFDVQHKAVVYTDSSYVETIARHSTRRREEFSLSGFYLPSKKAQASNVDMVREFHELYMPLHDRVSFKRIPRKENTHADRLAKEAARQASSVSKK